MRIFNQALYTVQIQTSSVQLQIAVGVPPISNTEIHTNCETDTI